MLASTLERVICDQRFSEVVRRDDILDRIRGFIVGASSEWLLFQTVEDFHVDGFALVRRSDITNVIYDGESMETVDRILRSEKTVVSMPRGVEVKLEGDFQLFESLRNISPVILDFEYDVADDYLYIGKLVSVSHDAAQIKTISTAAKWDTLETVQFADVSAIRFQNEYCRIFGKYVSS